MTKHLYRILALLAVLAYLVIISIMPYELFKIGYHSNIFPALDIIIIYFFSTHRTVKYWHLCILGIILDQLYNMPMGVNPLILIFAKKTLDYTIKSLLLQNNYLSNMLLFCAYSFLVVSLRYLAATIFGNYHIQGISIYFYYLTTILSYPIFYIILEKSLTIFNCYVK